jgi:hypothetical protein
MARSFALVLLACALSPVEAQQPRLDEPLAAIQITDPRGLHPCAIGMVVDQIARAGGLLAGFENEAGCIPSPRSDVSRAGSGAEVLVDISPRHALQLLMAVAPAFEWRVIDGVVIVRPKAAWDDAADLLNHDVRPFTVANEGMRQAVDTMLQAMGPRVFIPQVHVPRPARPIDQPINVAFSGGTMLEAVNVSSL